MMLLVGIRRIRVLLLQIRDIERQMLESKLVLVGDDVVPLKPLNAVGQANTMDPFSCIADTFGAHNTFTKVVTASTSDTT